jgi:hypothetical protein
MLLGCRLGDNGVMQDFPDHPGERAPILISLRLQSFAQLWFEPHRNLLLVRHGMLSAGSGY